MASGIAHELGTPLNVVGGRAKLIETGTIEGNESRVSARIIREQSERITRIVRQLLDFSRRSEAEKTRVDLRQVLQQAAALLHAFAQKRRTEIQLPAETEPLWSLADPAQIQQVATNLMLNGIQAMEGGGTLFLRCGVAHVQPPADLGGGVAERVFFEVEDQGAGIPPDALARIFDPFFTTKGVGEGTGLGLSVSWGIVREHGGWIAVDSFPGRGSCFRVYLPREEDSCAAAS
jgi:two-component system, NtrC family, sensor kinase